MTIDYTQDWDHALVYGLGLSGRAAVRLLRRRGVQVTAVDRREASELDLAEWSGDDGIDWRLGGEPAGLPGRLDGIVVSPGIPAERPLLVAAAKAGIPIIGEVELAAPLLNGPLLGITGSNGKSTVTALTGALLQACGYAVEVCGNIGRPLSDCVEGPEGRLFVTELSSFQLETVRTLRPRAAVLLNVSPDHLDRHGSLADYLAAKVRIFQQQGDDDVTILNADDPMVADLVVGARRRWFSRTRKVEDGCYLSDDAVVEVGPGVPERRLFDSSAVPLPGPQNLENAMASALLARAVGAAPDQLAVGLGSFEGLPHRLQRVASLSGVAWFDDSKGTNLGATRRSLESFEDGRVHLILGGRNKGADPAQLADVVKRKAARLYLIGEAAAEFANALEGTAPIEHSGALPAAVETAARRAQPGDTVLLSPACASFDQYNSFEERGRHFQQLVGALSPTDPGGERG